MRRHVFVMAHMGISHLKLEPSESAESFLKVWCEISCWDVAGFPSSFQSQQRTVTSCARNKTSAKTFQQSRHQKQPIRDFREFCTWSLFRVQVSHMKLFWQNRGKCARRGRGALTSLVKRGTPKCQRWSFSRPLYTTFPKTAMLPDLHNVFPAGTQRHTGGRHWNRQGSSNGQLHSLDQQDTLLGEGKKKKSKIQSQEEK